MLVDKTNFGLVLYKHANLYRFEKTSSYWSVKRISVFLCFSLVNQRHTSGITVYNRTVTNIENTVRAVHSCNSWYSGLQTFTFFSCKKPMQHGGFTLRHILHDTLTVKHLYFAVTEFWRYWCIRQRSFQYKSASIA